MEPTEDGDGVQTAGGGVFARDPAEADDPRLDAGFIKALLRYCNENVDDWLASTDATRTRRFIRELFAAHLHKHDDPQATLYLNDEHLQHVSGNCMQCRTAYYTCPSATCGNYLAYRDCMFQNGCRP